MGFLWFGKNIDSWKDIGSDKDLNDQKSTLELEWNINLKKKEEAQYLYDNLRTAARQPDISQPRKEQAAYQMSQQLKRQRRLDEELNLIQTNLETLQTVTSLREAEQRDKELSITLGNINPDKLEDTLKAATKARQDQKDLAKEINTIVTSQYSPIMIEAEKDQDWRASLADIDKP